MPVIFTLRLHDFIGHRFSGVKQLPTVSLSNSSVSNAIGTFIPLIFLFPITGSLVRQVELYKNFSVTIY